MEPVPCTLAICDCRQLTDASSVEHVHMVTEILSQVFRQLLSPLSRLKSVVSKALGALEPRDPLNVTTYLCSQVDSSFQSFTSMHPSSLAISTWTQP